MNQPILFAAALCVLLVSCGKKESTSQPTSRESNPAAVSIDALAAGQSAPAAPPTEAAPPPPEVAPAPATEPAADTPQVSGKREDMIEQWLGLYQGGDAAQKARVVKEVRAAKLSAREKALMEDIRSRYGYQKIPME
jgi:hypothetical protein